MKMSFLFLMGKVWASILIVMLRIERTQQNAILEKYSIRKLKSGLAVGLSSYEKNAYYFG